jgi:sugar lactone lactonase YvrE
MAQSAAPGISLYLLENDAKFRLFWWRGDGGLATQVQLTSPGGVALAPDGSMYFADKDHSRILRVSPDGIITTVAGNGGYGFSGDGGPATQATFAGPTGVTLAADGSLFIADADNHRIRRMGLDGLITTVAGNGESSYGSDGGLATQTGLNFPEAVALAADGSLYIADSGDRRIRRVGPDGIITTVAGNGQFGSSGDGDLATEATLLLPTGVVLAADGSLFIADPWSGRIRWVSPDGLITTVAGGGLAGSSGDGGPATQAHLSWPTGMALAADGSLFIADAGDSRIRRVGLDGVITTVAGTGQYGFSGDGGLATQAKFAWPHALTLAADGSLLIADADNHRIRRVGPDGIVTTVAGGGLSAGSGSARPRAPYCQASLSGTLSSPPQMAPCCIISTPPGVTCGVSRRSQARMPIRLAMMRPAGSSR